MTNHTDENGKSAPAKSKVARKMRTIERGRLVHRYNKIIRKNSERQAASSALARKNAPDGRSPPVKKWTGKTARQRVGGTFGT